jgi:hypothetical protein
LEERGEGDVAKIEIVGPWPVMIEITKDLLKRRRALVLNLSGDRLVIRLSNGNAEYRKLGRRPTGSFRFSLVRCTTDAT